MTAVLEESVDRYTDEPGSGRVTSAVSATVVDGPIYLALLNPHEVSVSFISAGAQGAQA